MILLDDRLAELQAKLDLQQHLKEKKQALSRQKLELLEKMEMLAVTMKKEERQLQNMEQVSLASLWYRLLGKHAEKLTRERAEAYAAKLKYDTAVLELKAIDQQLRENDDRLRQLENCRAEYNAAWREKVQAVKASETPEGQRVLELEQRITTLESKLRETREAVAIGAEAERRADEVVKTLDKAGGWATADLFSDSMWTDLIKYDHLDSAQDQIHMLQIVLRRFRSELADVKVFTDLEVSVDGITRFADYAFDCIFVDWDVREQIKNSAYQAELVRIRIGNALEGLRQLEQTTLRELEELHEEHEKFVKSMRL